MWCCEPGCEQRGAPYLFMSFMMVGMPSTTTSHGLICTPSPVRTCATQAATAAAHFALLMADDPRHNKGPAHHVKTCLTLSVRHTSGSTSTRLTTLPMLEPSIASTCSLASRRACAIAARQGAWDCAAVTRREARVAAACNGASPGRPTLASPRPA